MSFRDAAAIPGGLADNTDLVDTTAPTVNLGTITAGVVGTRQMTPAGRVRGEWERHWDAGSFCGAGGIIPMPCHASLPGSLQPGRRGTIDSDDLHGLSVPRGGCLTVS